MTDSLEAVFRIPGRRTRAIVDLDAIAANVRALRANQRPEQRLMAVVKAEGYGHGSVMVARTALEAGAASLGVATVAEAATLREAGIVAPVLILGPIDPSEVDRAIGLDVELTIGSYDELDAIQSRAEALGARAPVHVKVDTGMHRFGVAVPDAPGILDAVTACASIRVAGVCTHLATADDADSTTADQQLRAFTELVAANRALIPVDAAVHAGNSAVSIRRLFPTGTFDRVGIALYGLRPGREVDLLPGMWPALSVVSRLSRVHTAYPGDGVSYGHTYVASGPERLGLLPIGYADGYPRGLFNLSTVRIGDADCPVRGRICMDQTVAGDLPDSARVGDLVGVLGPIGGAPAVDELARLTGTINYEIVSGLSPRIPRFYVRNREIVASLREGRLDAP